MEHTERTTPQPTRLIQKKKSLPLLITGITCGVLLLAYIGLCTFASLSSAIFPNTMVAGSWNVGGLSVGDAERQLMRQESHWSDDTALTLTLTPPESSQTTSAGETKATLTFGDLGGVTMDANASAQRAFDAGHDGNFFVLGYRYLRSLLTETPVSPVLQAEALPERSAALAEQLSVTPVDTRYEMGENAILITKAKDGLTVNSATLGTALSNALADFTYTDVTCPYIRQPAQTLSAQAIYEEVAGEMKNAGFDPTTKTITAEQVGAEFDVSAATALLENAAPGAVVDVPAQIQQPAVTAEQLSAVLFRDVLGTYSTHVGGSSARIGNVKLSSAAINGHILNSGDIFSYNDVVGKRTKANGYLPAPAYVKGETVDEVGGGICQTSSTLYMTTLLSNLEIVTRAAHRYVPAYIPKGMDATVSWGGPEYRFANNTDYPIKIVASVSSKNYLTIAIYGTKVDDTYVKITNEVLGTTPFEVKYEDDPTLPAGKEVVKQTPYTGCKVRTYRNIYNGDGKLISSTFEASSDYKSRDKIIQRNPASVPVEAPVTPVTPVTPPTTPPTTPTTPPTTPTTPTTPDTGTTPPDSGGGTLAPSGDGSTGGGFDVIDPADGQGQ